ncbi:MAG: TauD/TfdA family dioxygenase [Ectothiorhodospiraceae bacterium]|nr:TauD/TfdA family dioxygenase [Ectothiorhodospiraceae bacterium]
MSAVVAPKVAASPMPDGPLGGPAAWRADELRRSDEWMHVLSPAEIAEVDAAVRAVDVDGRAIAGIGRAEFRLPMLGPVLDRIREDVLWGRGFVLLRGLPVERYSPRQRAIAYWGIGLHFGRAVSQNAMGHLLGHVIDLGRSNDDYTARTYQTNARQFFHADSCDIVGLLCVRRARSGGASAIVSSVTVYNEMLARSPELTAELFQPMFFDRRGEVPEGSDPWYEMPVFNWHAGNLSTHYVRRYITSIRRLPQVPPLTEAQVAALDLLDTVVEEPHVQLRMELEPGDMQFLHNPQILHDRTAFEDFDDPALRRHLLRLWLCAENARPLPACYAQRWGSNTIGARGGIVVRDAIAHVPLEP